MESITRGSSCGTNGSCTGSDPAAMIAVSKTDGAGRAVRAGDRRACSGEVNVPVPTMVVTLRCLASPARPPVSRPTTPSFQPRRASRSMVGRAKDRPCAAISLVSAMTLAACSSAFEGMQPTLRHTPPSGPRRVDQHDLLAQVRGPERGGVAARARRRGRAPRRARHPPARCRATGRRAGRCPVRCGRRGRRAVARGCGELLGSPGIVRRLRRAPMLVAGGGRLVRCGACHLDGADDRALPRPVSPTDDREFADGARHGRGHVQSRLVALQGEQRVIDRDRVAGRRRGSR